MTSPDKREPHKCKCALCSRHRRMDMLMRRGTRKQLAESLEELLNQLCYAESELEYLQVIMDGSWPSAVEQLRTALKRAKNRRKKGKINAD